MICSHKEVSGAYTYHCSLSDGHGGDHVYIVEGPSDIQEAREAQRKLAHMIVYAQQLEGKLGDVRAALEPFARMAEVLERDLDPLGFDGYATITMADLRRLASLYREGA